MWPMRAPWGGVAFGLLAACSFGSPADPRSDAPDGDAPPADAAEVDAAADAAPFVCDFPGVQCPGGQPLQMLGACARSGECWVGCVNGAAQTPAQAMAFCQDLGMKLGAFDSAADETCVRNAGINGQIMLGITQRPDQANDDEGWIRISDNLPVQYFNWDSGQPNDSSGIEDNEEQCASSNTNVQWHDIPCTTVASARWICRRP